MIQHLGRAARTPSPWRDLLPIRSELFGIDRLEDHARSLASAQPVSARHASGPGLSSRLAENAAFLLQASRALAPEGGGRQELTPAAEWLVDNYHLIEVQIREIGIDLPPRYYAQLPKLADGPLAGLPRVFGAMWSLVAHIDSDVYPATLRRYLLAYQEVQPLTIGELWAVPITFRIVLIENLRRVAAVIAANSAARNMADGLADRLLGFRGHAAEPWSVVGDSVRPTPAPDAFAVQLAHRLRGRDPRGEPALAWLDGHLAERGVRIEGAVHDELHQQGTFNATIRNIITSPRMAAALDWTEAFETVCHVDAELDQSGRFGGMDFATRNLYRTAIEQLARRSDLGEVEIARRAAACGADAQAAHPPDDRRGDPGYHLLAGGRRRFEAAIGFRPSLHVQAVCALRALGLLGYGTGVVAVAALLLAGPLWALVAAGTDGWWLLLLGCAGIVPASDAAVACVNRFSMWAVGATPLPALELRDGIPAPLRTMVAVPALLTSLRAVDELVGRLEIHHLASPDHELHFALLPDWTDSAAERADGDEALLQAALHELMDRTGPRQVRPRDRAALLAGLAPSLRKVTTLAHGLATAHEPGATDDLVFWTDAIGRAVASHSRDLGPLDGALDRRLAAIELACRDMALAMEFGFLRNEERKLLSIGYLVGEGTTDANCYDLLASEARLACFLAIAKGDVPAREWFRLGRTMTPVDHGAALVSWSGSMFEYLMPSLVMRAPTGSLLYQTNRLAVRRQIEFGRTRAIPWGASESAYNVRDLEYTYQYSNFGVPDLGLKRGLDDEFVVAPYATALASMVDPAAAVANLASMAADGALGRHGFYEALDYTPGRVPEGRTVAVVRAFMAHHQGMSIVAIADATLDGIMRTRFHADPLIEATELLLQERAPHGVTSVREPPAAHRPVVRARDVAAPGGRRFATAQAATPDTHLLCNGAYTVMLTASGSGYSRWRDVAVTRWREDPTLDDWGSHIYLRDVDSGRVWSAGARPCGAAPDEYAVVFTEDRARFSRRDGTLTTSMEILLSAEESAEVRRVTVSNTVPVARTIDVTSYAELSLSPQAADIAHPAFAKLFVETEHLAETGALLASRRRRTPSEPEIWAAHLAVADGAVADGRAQVETDRARFIGRGRTLHDPAALDENHALSGTVGTVLDPVFSIRRRITVAPGGMARVAFWTMVAPSRDAITACIDRHRDIGAFDRAAMMAWTQAQVQLHHLGITPVEADLFQRLAGHLLFAGPALRSPSGQIGRGVGAQSGLWGQGISGDLPILLLTVDDVSDLGVARQLLLAHTYFRLKRFAVDLVIVNEHPASYAQELQGALEALLRAQRDPRDEPAGPGRPSITLLRADLVPQETCALLASVARVVLAGDRGRLCDQLDRAERQAPAAEAPAMRSPGRPTRPAPHPGLKLELFNGLGGFAEDGREYVVVLGPGQATPAPWINVIANAGFGFQVAAEGSGYT